MTYRVGNHHGVTIVREPDQQAVCCNRDDHDCQRGHLVAVVVNGDQALAERIVALLNADKAGVFACDACDKPEYHRHIPPRPYTESSVEDWDWKPDSCTCTIVGPHPDCPVHHGRRARGPKPPPIGPGRTCPRHGAVI